MPPKSTVYQWSSELPFPDERNGLERMIVQVRNSEENTTKPFFRIVTQDSFSSDQITISCLTWNSQHWFVVADAIAALESLENRKLIVNAKCHLEQHVLSAYGLYTLTKDDQQVRSYLMRLPSPNPCNNVFSNIILYPWSYLPLFIDRGLQEIRSPYSPTNYTVTGNWISTVPRDDFPMPDVEEAGLLSLIAISMLWTIDYDVVYKAYSSLSTVEKKMLAELQWVAHNGLAKTEFGTREVDWLTDLVRTSLAGVPNDKKVEQLVLSLNYPNVWIDGHETQTIELEQGKAGVREKLIQLYKNCENNCLKQCLASETSLSNCKPCAGTSFVSVTCGNCRGKRVDGCFGCSGKGYVKAPCGNCDKQSL